MLLCWFWSVVVVDFSINICIRLVGGYKGWGASFSNCWELVVGGCGRIAWLLLQLPYRVTHVHKQHVLAPLYEALLAFLLIKGVFRCEQVSHLLFAWLLLINALGQYQIFLGRSVRFRFFLAMIIFWISYLEWPLIGMLLVYHQI